MKRMDYQYEEWCATKHLTNADAQLDIKEAPGSDRFLVIENITISVHEPAIGGGGKLKFINTEDGGDVWEIDVNGIKDISIPLGWKEMDVNQGLQAILYGAGINQASVWVSVTGYIFY